MLEIILFLFLGILIGVIMGLIPGIHPNMIVLAVPLLASFSIGNLPLLAFIVAIGITNTMIDFIPSIFFGAPESGKELSTLPGHRMLMRGHGYDAIKLTVVGGVGAVIFIALLLPLLILIVPIAFVTLRPIIYLLLLAIVLLMILTEKGRNKIIAAVIFMVSGSIGLLMNKFPLDPTLVLFPVFSGFFGLGLLFLQVRNKTKIPKQKSPESFFSRKQMNRSVVAGSLGGVAAGFLPGVGSSEIATLATLDKNDKSFLVTTGALTMANIILSILCLWLISRPRSGLAVVINQLAEVGFNEVIFIVIISLITVGIAVVLTLKLAKFFLNIIGKIKYDSISKIIIAFIVVLSVVFTGWFGLFLLILCTALGIFTNLSNVKRGNLMGVLILPTLLFYAGL